MTGVVKIATHEVIRALEVIPTPHVSAVRRRSTPPPDLLRWIRVILDLELDDWWRVDRFPIYTDPKAHCQNGFDGMSQSRAYLSP